MEQQFALTLPLLKSSSLLDNATKTESILTLLSLNYNTTDNDNIQNDQHMIIQGKHGAFLENQILGDIIATTNNNTITTNTTFINNTI